MSVRQIPFNANRFRCPECHRFMSRGTESKALMCAYASDHEGNAVIYQVQPAWRNAEDISAEGDQG